jgi:uncharacterized protein (TIGR04551 family)
MIRILTWRTVLSRTEHVGLSLCLSLCLISLSYAQGVPQPSPASGSKTSTVDTKAATPDAETSPAVSNDQEGQHDAAKEAAIKAKKAAKNVKKPNKASVKKSKRALKKTPSSVEQKKLRPNWDSPILRAPKMGYPWIEHHGYLRTRADLFHGFDLGTYDAVARTGSSPFLPPLTELDENGNLHPGESTDRFAQGAQSLSSANIRFRYQPTIHVSESLRINTTLDILDNLVLGSTPVGGPHASRTNGSDSDIYALPDPSLSLFNDSQKATDSGVTGLRDSVRVKHLWGEWISPLGALAFGRMPNHWGLGLMANAGQCLDCDFGDSVDRLMGTILLLDTYLAVGWDFADEGAVGFPGEQTFRSQGMGQPYDLEQRDDVSQYTVAIFQKPISRKEKQRRMRQLYEKRAPSLDWGLYNVIRSQTVESGYNLDGLTTDNALQYQLFEVDGFTYSPDLWLDVNWVPNPESSYRLQLEMLGVFGSVEEIPQQYALERTACLDGGDPEETDCDVIEQRRRDIDRFGYAVEFDAKHGAFDWGFHHGMASGDKNEGFGYLSNSELRAPDSGLTSPDRSLTALRFDRDYHVDLILFRELIGGVTNATYFKPYLGYRFIDQPTEVWGFQLSALYGHALEASATPGNDASLGLEFDLELYIHEIDRFQLRFMYGLLLPMSAFDRLNESGVVVAEPETAQTLQILIGIEF